MSQNIKFGLWYRFRNGEVRVNHDRFLSYIKNEEGNFVLEPTEAEAVKQIYREYLEGASLLQIRRGLEVNGILTGAGKTKWCLETLKKILQNEKYIGDALLQKTYAVDFLNKKRVQNKGIVSQYYVENSHEPIIPRDFYMHVQEEMIRQKDETSSEVIEAKLMELQKELLKLTNSKKDYNSVADEIAKLRGLKQNTLVESAEREELKQRIREMREFQEQQITEYDELLVRRLIEKVMVYDERFEVEFKSGAKVDVER